MVEKIQSNLSGVPETMLIAIRARMQESLDPRGIIHDPKSIEILERIECSGAASKPVSLASQKGVAIRTEIFDEIVSDFLQRHPHGIVVNLGCGLDTRHYRLGSPPQLWIELDLPEAIALRRHFFDETAQYRFLSHSVLDYAWIEQIPQGQPTLFVAEGLLVYLPEEGVRELMRQIGAHFPGAEFALEVLAPLSVRMRQMHPDVDSSSAPFLWGLSDGRELEQWGVGATLIRQEYYLRHLGRMPWWLALVYQLFGRMSSIVYIRFA